MNETFKSERAPEPVGAFPHAKRVGELLFLSGIGPRVRGSKEIPGVTLDSSGNVVSYDFETQCHAVFDNVRLVLEGMLRVMAQLKQPGQPPRTIALRGLSWIVNAYDDGGVVIAIEITMGAAIAGPFQIDKAQLEAMITRVMAPPIAPSSTTVH